jgi:hypothetical protein
VSQLNACVSVSAILLLIERGVIHPATIYTTCFINTASDALVYTAVASCSMQNNATNKPQKKAHSSSALVAAAAGCCKQRLQAAHSAQLEVLSTVCQWAPLQGSCACHHGQSLAQAQPAFVFTASYQNESTREVTREKHIYFAKLLQRCTHLVTRAALKHDQATRLQLNAGCHAQRAATSMPTQGAYMWHCCCFAI